MSYTPTTNFGLKKPNYGDPADIKDLNDDMDDIDTIMHQNRLMLATPFSQNEDYSEGKMVVYEGASYRFKTDHSAGNWDASEVDPMPIADGASGGGSAVVTKTAEGNPITFSDGADAPLVECVATVEASQDLHGYDKPWVGGAGKNKFDTLYRTGYKLDPDTGAMTTSSNQDVGRIVCKDNTAYTLSIKDTTGYSNSRRIVMCFYDSNDAPISATVTSVLYVASQNPNPSCTIQSVTGAEYLYFSSYSVSTEIQVEEGTTATSYEPYSNICPISGMSEVGIEVRGKNLYNPATRTNDYFIKDNGTISANADACYSDLIPIIVGQSYTFSGYTTLGGTKRMHCYDEDGNWISLITSVQAQANSDYTITGVIPNNAKYIRISLLKTDIDVQVEEGSTATTYEPYAEHTYTIDLDGTRYGGTVDVARGKLVVTHIYDVLYGSENWYQHDSYTTNFGIKKSSYNLSATTTGLCDCYEFKYETTATRHNGVISIYSGTFGNYGNSKWVVIRDDRFSSTTDLKTWLANNNVHYIYKLDTPIEVNLTPTQVRTLLGDNYISTDAKKLNLTYITQEYQPLVDLIESNSGKHVYSTDEQVVGTWIDGSDVYERTIKVDNPTESSSPTNLTTLTNENVIDLQGFLIVNDASNTRLYNNFFESSSYQLRMWQEGTYIKYRATYGNIGLKQISATIRYTKTTQTRSISPFRSEISLERQEPEVEEEPPVEAEEEEENENQAENQTK